MKFLGCRGTTGTEASFVELFEGDTAKIDEMNRLISAEFGFDRCFDVCGQTYPRKVDSRILNCLSSIAQSAYRMANDIRLLQHDRQLEEPFEEEPERLLRHGLQAQPHALGAHLLPGPLFDGRMRANAPMTASAQWMERTLDDSANRRISPCRRASCAPTPSCVLHNNVTPWAMWSMKRSSTKPCVEYLPFIATENLMMEAVKRGGDRQELHEIIRRCSPRRPPHRMKEGLKPATCFDRLAAEPAFGMSPEDELSARAPIRRITLAAARNRWMRSLQKYAPCLREPPLHPVTLNCKEAPNGKSVDP